MRQPFMLPAVFVCFLSTGAGDLRAQGPDDYGVRTFPVGGRAHALVIEDFDKDGRLDVATPNGVSFSVSVLLGDESALFKTAVDYRVDFNQGVGELIAIAAADFDVDADPDLAVADFANDKVHVLKNNAGAFDGSPVTLDAGAAPIMVAVGDLDQKNGPDLVCVNSGANSITVFLQDGAGAFTGSTLRVGSNPLAVAVGDLDKDGDLDLAVANRSSAEVSLLYGNGDGTFPAATNQPVINQPSYVVAADLDGDNDLDLAMSSDKETTIDLLIRRPPRSFSLGTPVELGVKSLSISAADMNGDQRVDLLTANAVDNSIAILHRGAVGGRFEAPILLPTGMTPRQVAAADLDADGDVDLVSSNRTSQDVTVFVAGGLPPEPNFLRADCNDDGAVNLSDALCILQWLFMGAPAPGCVAVTTANGDAEASISDPIYILESLFMGGPPPVEPFPACGPGTLAADKDLGCETPPAGCPQ